MKLPKINITRNSLLSFFKAFSITIVLATIIYSIGYFFSDKPENVRITNLGSNSFTVSWTTKNPTEGVVYFSSSPIFKDLPFPIAGLVAKKAYDDRDVSQHEISLATDPKAQMKSQPFYTHSVTVKGLEFSSKYYFKLGNHWFSWGDKSILSAESVFFESGEREELSVITMPLASALQAPDPSFGRIFTPDGNPAKDKIVTVYFYNGQQPEIPLTNLMSTVTGDDGDYYFDLSNAKNFLTGENIQIPESSEIVQFITIIDQEGIKDEQQVPVTLNSPVGDIKLPTNRTGLVKPTMIFSSSSTDSFTTESTILNTALSINKVQAAVGDDCHNRNCGNGTCYTGPKPYDGGWQCLCNSGPNTALNTLPKTCPAAPPAPPVAPTQIPPATGATSCPSGSTNRGPTQFVSRPAANCSSLTVNGTSVWCCPPVPTATPIGLYACPAGTTSSGPVQYIGKPNAACSAHTINGVGTWCCPAPTQPPANDCSGKSCGQYGRCITGDNPNDGGWGCTCNNGTTIAPNTHPYKVCPPPNTNTGCNGNGGCLGGANGNTCVNNGTVGTVQYAGQPCYQCLNGTWGLAANQNMCRVPTQNLCAANQDLFRDTRPAIYNAQQCTGGNEGHVGRSESGNQFNYWCCNKAPTACPSNAPYNLGAVDRYAQPQRNNCTSTRLSSGMHWCCTNPPTTPTPTGISLPACPVNVTLSSAQTPCRCESRLQTLTAGTTCPSGTTPPPTFPATIRVVPQCTIGTNVTSPCDCPSLRQTITTGVCPADTLVATRLPTLAPTEVPPVTVQNPCSGERPYLIGTDRNNNPICHQTIGCSSVSQVNPSSYLRTDPENWNLCVNYDRNARAAPIGGAHYCAAPKVRRCDTNTEVAGGRGIAVQVTRCTCTAPNTPPPAPVDPLAGLSNCTAQQLNQQVNLGNNQQGVGFGICRNGNTRVVYCSQPYQYSDGRTNTTHCQAQVQCTSSYRMSEESARRDFDSVNGYSSCMLAGQQWRECHGEPFDAGRNRSCTSGTTTTPTPGASSVINTSYLDLNNANQSRELLDFARTATPTASIPTCPSGITALNTRNPAILLSGYSQCLPSGSTIPVSYCTKAHEIFDAGGNAYCSDLPACRGSNFIRRAEAIGAELNGRFYDCVIPGDTSNTMYLTCDTPIFTDVTLRSFRCGVPPAGPAEDIGVQSILPDLTLSYDSNSKLPNLHIFKSVSAQEASSALPDSVYIVDSKYIFFAEEGTYSLEIQGKTYTIEVDTDSNYRVFVDTNKNKTKDSNEPYVDEVQDIKSIKIAKLSSDYAFTFKPGYNFVSFPFVMPSSTNSATELLKYLKTKGNFALISRYDGGWKTMTETSSTNQASNFAIVPGSGYVIRLLDSFPVSVSLSGFPLEESATLKVTRGWNLVGMYSPSKIYLATTMVRGMADKGLETINVTKFDDALYSGIQIEGDKKYGFDFPIEYNKGYFINVRTLPNTNDTSYNWKD